MQMEICQFYVKRLTFSIKYSILLLHLKKCSNMKMLAAYGWRGL